MKIAVAGTGYVGLSLAVLLAQNNEVTAVDIIPEKVDLINNKKSPIQDDYIEKYLAETADGYQPKNIKFYTYAKLMLAEDEIPEIQPDYIILDKFHRCGAESWGQGSSGASANVSRCADFRTFRNGDPLSR